MQRRTQAGSEWDWKGPGLIAGRSFQLGGFSVATMSSRFTRQGVPSMMSRQPSQRIATLSLTMVVIRTPSISIERDGSREPEALDAVRRSCHSRLARVGWTYRWMSGAEDHLPGGR